MKSIDPTRWKAATNTFIVLCVCSAPLATVAAEAIQKRALVFSNVRVFDGERVLPLATVVVQDDKIRTVAERVRPPDGAEVINGVGMTLLPGLIDSHVHLSGRALLQQALMFGVTTTLHMFTTNPQPEVDIRKAQAEGRASDRADLFSSGIGVTAPGGHGTQYGVAIPTLTDPAQAQAFVDARIAEGSDYIKIIVDPGSPNRKTPKPLPTLSSETLIAAISAAKRRNKLAVVHAQEENCALQAIEAGANGLVHIYHEGRPNLRFARLAKARGVFVIPTLTVLEGYTGTPSGESLASDARLAPYLRQDQLANLRKSLPKERLGPNESYSVAQDMVRLLKDEGVRILAGSDCPNLGTAHGVSLHREMELLVQAGLTPIKALQAATSAPAMAFRLEDRGGIKPAMRADLLLVRGDPTESILATRDIVGVWKAGIAADRERFRTELQKENLSNNQ